MAGTGAGLVSASPYRPAQPVGGIGDGLDDQGREQALDLVAGHRDQPCRWWVSGVFGQGCHDQEGVGEHGKGGPAVPGPPAADLVLVQATKALAGLKSLLNLPTTMHS